MKSNNRQHDNQQSSNVEVQQSNQEQIKEITDAQRDGIRYDYTDSSDFK